MSDLLESAYHEVMPELRLLAQAFVDPTTFTRFVLEVLNPLSWSACTWKCEDLGDGDLRVTCRLHPGARPNEIFLQAVTGALRGAPRHLGLPAAEILSAHVEPTYAEYEVRMPASRTLASRGVRLSQALLGRVTAHLVWGHDDLEDPLETRLHDRSTKWGLARRQAAVLRLVAKGHANKEIAAMLGCATSTVELHVTRLLQKSGTSSRAQLIAAFWQDEAEPA